MPAKKFIPALKYKILTPMLDPVLSLLMKDALLKSRLVAQLNPRAGDQVLDFGCGTGTLAIMIKKASADTIVTGIDVDPQVLEIARGKAREQDQDTQFIEYPGTALPFSDQSFDKAVTSLVIHHLYAEQKRRAFAELRRVLKRGGELHILDFGVQRSPYTRFITSVSRRFEPVEDNLLGKIPAYLTSAGFVNCREVSYENTLLGTVSFYLAVKP